MKRFAILLILAVGIGVTLPAVSSGQKGGGKIPKKYHKTIEKGLAWLAKQQHKDGHWGAQGDQYRAPMTALAAHALLMEGSTVREGRYAKNIKLAVDWLINHTQKGGQNDGLITDPGESSRYMYGHGFAMLFLASVYGDEEDKTRRERLKEVLTRAVKFSAAAQSNQGGWYYTAAGGTNNDEGSVTITQLQGLRAARNAGIPVPKEVIAKAQDYLKKSTTAQGGVVYRLGPGNFGAPVGGERPALTAAAIACGFSAGDYNSPLVKSWFKYCRTAIPIGVGQRIGHDEYTHYYYAQALYMLGDDGWEKLFGKTPKDQQLTWSRYREQMFDELMRMQNADGSWTGGGGFSVGPVYATAVYLTIMQLDRAVLPIYQR